MQCSIIFLLNEIWVKVGHWAVSFEQRLASREPLSIEHWAETSQQRAIEHWAMRSCSKPKSAQCSFNANSAQCAHPWEQYISMHRSPHMIVSCNILLIKIKHKTETVCINVVKHVTSLTWIYHSLTYHILGTHTTNLITYDNCI